MDNINKRNTVHFSFTPFSKYHTVYDMKLILNYFIVWKLLVLKIKLSSSSQSGRFMLVYLTVAASDIARGGSV